MQNWLEILVTLSLFTAACLITVWFVCYILIVVIEEIRRNQFNKDFHKSVKVSEPTWDEIKQIASTRELTQSDVLSIIKEQYREILKGENDELLAQKDLIKSYIAKYHEEEPFEGLPSEIKLHLERIKEQIDQDNGNLEALTNQIKDLLTVYKKEHKKQKYYTVGGFFVGVAGLGFAIYCKLSG